MKKSGPLHYLGTLLVVAVFVIAAWLLKVQVEKYHLTFATIRANLLQIRPEWIVLAIALTAVNYVVLVFFDYLAFRFAKVPISLTRCAFAAVVTYAFSYNFGATIAGIPLRYRLYSSWNIPLTKIVQLLVILGFTFWFGVFALSGTLFVFAPLRIPSEKLEDICRHMVTDFHLSERTAAAFRHLIGDSTLFGLVLLGLAILYVGTSLVHRGSIKIFSWTVPVPPPQLTISQIAIASADMFVAAAVFYSLCPHVHGGYFRVLEVYLVAYVLNVLSHVPGGWGVIETVIIGLLCALEPTGDPDAFAAKVAASVVVFRVIYFLLPLAVAAVLVAWHEYALRRNWISPLAQYADSHVVADTHAVSSNGQAPKLAPKTPVEKK